MQENQLPLVWAEFANATKAQQLAVLQFAIDDKKRSCAEPDLQFIVNASTLQCQCMNKLINDLSVHDTIASEPFFKFTLDYSNWLLK